MLGGDEAMMTHHKKLVRRAEQKAARKNAKLKAEIPLFADQVPASTAIGEYWHTRFVKAGAIEGVEELMADRMLEQFHAGCLRQLAQRVLPAEAFERLNAEHWVQEAYPVMYWTQILTTTKRHVLRYDREVFLGPFLTKGPKGPDHYSEKVRIIEAEVWPPAGWVPPFSAEQINDLLRIAPPLDHPGDAP